MNISNFKKDILVQLCVSVTGCAVWAAIVWFKDHIAGVSIPHLGKFDILQFAYIAAMAFVGYFFGKRSHKAHPVDPLKEKTLQLGRDLFAFLREKPPILPDSSFAIPDAEWSAARNAQWSAAEPIYHGYMLRFKQRVIDLFHELAERGIENKPLKWEELQSWEFDPPEPPNPLALDVPKIARYLLLLASKMDIERESKKP